MLIGCLLSSLLVGMEDEMPKALQQVTQYLDDNQPLIRWLRNGPPCPTKDSLYDEDDKAIVVASHNRVFSLERKKNFIEGYYEIGKDPAWIFKDPVYENPVTALKILNEDWIGRYIMIGRKGMVQVISKVPDVEGLYATTDIKMKKTPTNIITKESEDVGISSIDFDVECDDGSRLFYTIRESDQRILSAVE